MESTSFYAQGRLMPSNAFFINNSYNLKFYCNLTAYDFVYISERTFQIGGN